MEASDIYFVVLGTKPSGVAQGDAVLGQSGQCLNDKGMVFVASRIFVAFAVQGDHFDFLLFEVRQESPTSS